jgi:hypothetical protein
MTFTAAGNTKEGKFWLKSDSEPGAALVVNTETDVTAAGRVGFHGFQPNCGRMLALGIGLNGAPAPRPLP